VSQKAVLLDVLARHVTQFGGAAAGIELQSVASALRDAGTPHVVVGE
jgi:hypothetical protein